MVVRGVSISWTGYEDSVEDFKVCRAADAEWARCFCWCRARGFGPVWSTCGAVDCFSAAVAWIVHARPQSSIFSQATGIGFARDALTAKWTGRDQLSGADQANTHDVPRL